MNELSSSDDIFRNFSHNVRHFCLNFMFFGLCHYEQIILHLIIHTQLSIITNFQLNFTIHVFKFTLVHVNESIFFIVLT